EDPPTPILFERTFYGESHPTPNDANARGHQWRQFDGAGLTANDRYDFKGNPVKSTHRLASDYPATPDWTVNPLDPPKSEEVTTTSWFDALNRPIQVVPPHSTRTTISVLRPFYNVGGLLQAQCVWLARDAEPDDNELLDPVSATFQSIEQVAYNAKSQR